MNPLLVCSYRGRYLEVVLRWLVQQRVPEKYRVLVWDNGGAAEVCSRWGIACHALRNKATGQAINLGKAAAMRFLVDIVRETLPGADCYLCMDDDVIVNGGHLDALVAAARRPGLGMIGPRFHPFNTVTPPDFRVVRVGADGPALRIYPPEDRTARAQGKVAGTLFAVSRATVARLEWSPYLYPIPTLGDRPIVYWTEDATLDIALTRLGFVNGYLDDPALCEVLHLPDLNQDYVAWKLGARQGVGLSPDNPF